MRQLRRSIHSALYLYSTPATTADHWFYDILCILFFFSKYIWWCVRYVLTYVLVCLQSVFNYLWIIIIIILKKSENSQQTKTKTRQQTLANHGIRDYYWTSGQIKYPTHNSWPLILRHIFYSFSHKYIWCCVRYYVF